MTGQNAPSRTRARKPGAGTRDDFTTRVPLVLNSEEGVARKEIPVNSRMEFSNAGYIQPGIAHNRARMGEDADDASASSRTHGINFGLSHKCRLCLHRHLPHQPILKHSMRAVGLLLPFAPHRRKLHHLCVAWQWRSRLKVIPLRHPTPHLPRQNCQRCLRLKLPSIGHQKV